MIATQLNVKPKVLIPYLQTWDIADFRDEWKSLAKEVDFIKYQIMDVDEFRHFFKESSIDCLWVTDEFVEYLGGPSAFWEYYPETLKAIVVPWVGCEFIDGERLRKEKDIILCNIGPNASSNVADIALFLVIGCFRLTSFWEHCFRFATHGNVTNTRLYIGGSTTEKVSIQSTGENGSKYSGSYKFPRVIDPHLRHDVNLSKTFTIAGKSIDSPAGKTALILGFGSIGQAIGKKLHYGLDMNVTYHKRSGPVAFEILGYKASFCGDLKSSDTWKGVDLIVLSLPKNSSTTKLINDRVISMCKNGVRIVNVGRGSCIDEDSLVRALDSGKVTSCALDVFENENEGINKDLLDRWDVTLLPHIGSAVSEMIVRQTLVTLDNIRNIFVDGGKGAHPIN